MISRNGEGGPVSHGSRSNRGRPAGSQAPLSVSERGGRGVHSREDNGGRGQALLQRILYWTGGHPYLTQRLCQAVADDAQVTGPGSVDRLCEGLFLSPRAREQDDNLLFVRERLLHSEADLASLLELYGQVSRGKHVADDETNPLITVLRLSGIVQVVDGHLRVRNRIYGEVFDPKWARTNMPDAELRRQRAAYRRGVLRATAVAAVVAAVMGGLAFVAVRQTRHAARVAEQARQERQAAAMGQQTLRRHRYASHMILAQHLWESGNLGSLAQVLEAQRPDIGQEDLRGWEWRYFWRLSQQDEARSVLKTDFSFERQFAISPDGRLIAAPTELQPRVDLWDVATRRKVASLSGLPAPVEIVRFSPDGKMLATRCDGAKEVRLWEVTSRRAIAAFRQEDTLGQIAFSPDNRHLTTGSETAITVWDFRTRQRTASYPRSKTDVIRLVYSPTGRLLAAKVRGDTVEVWDMERRRRVAALPGGSARIRSLDFSADRRLLAGVESPAGRVRVWEIPSETILATFPAPPGNVTVAFAPDSQRLAARGGDQTVRVWNLVTKSEEAVFRGHKRWPISVAFTPDGRFLISGDIDGNLRFWPIPRRDPELLTGLRDDCEALAFSSDGKRLVASGATGAIKVWEIASRKLLAAMKAPEGVYHVAFSADGRTIASGSPWGSERVWDLPTRHLLHTFPKRSDQNRPVMFSPDGRRLALSGEGHAVILWDVATRREVGRLRGHRNEIGFIVFSSDGRQLATGSLDGTARVWDIAGRREIRRFRHSDSVFRLGFSPNGRWLAGGGFDDVVRVWDIAAGQEITTLEGYTQEIGRVEFSPDGKTLLTCDSRGPIHLWSKASWRETAVFEEPLGRYNAVDFSPDGNILAVGRADGTVRLMRATALSEVDLPSPVASGGNGEVLLQWPSVLNAQAYNVYWDREGAPGSGLRKLNSQPVAATSFLDHDSGPATGRARTYAVAALFPGIAPGMAGRQQLVEGPPVTIQAVPIAAPGGWWGTTINEGPRFGSVLFEPSGTPGESGAGEILIRGGGADIWGSRDGFHFLNQALSGDFQLTATALTRPTGPDPFAKAGLMIREGLAPNARHASLFLHYTAGGLQLQWRPAPGAATEGHEVVPPERLRTPVVLRLTRRGSRIDGECSWNGGKSFQPSGSPVVFTPGLSKVLQVGLAISAHDPNRTTEARFHDLAITPLPR
jgi:WD40 repeat protein